MPAANERGVSFVEMLTVSALVATLLVTGTQFGLDVGASAAESEATRRADEAASTVAHAIAAHVSRADPASLIVDPEYPGHLTFQLREDVLAGNGQDYILRHILIPNSVFYGLELTVPVGPALIAEGVPVGSELLCLLDPATRITTTGWVGQDSVTLEKRYGAAVGPCPTKPRLLSGNLALEDPDAPGMPGVRFALEPRANGSVLVHVTVVSEVSGPLGPARRTLTTTVAVGG